MAEGSSPSVGDGVDVTVAHSPRIRNYRLGGKDNFAVDREIGDRLAALFPPIVDIARSSRAFLDRAVTFTARSGVRRSAGSAARRVSRTGEVRGGPTARPPHLGGVPGGWTGPATRRPPAAC